MTVPSTVYFSWEQKDSEQMQIPSSLGEPTSHHHYRGSQSWNLTSLKGKTFLSWLKQQWFGGKKNLSCILTYSLANVMLKNLKCSWMLIVIKWTVNTRLDTSEVPTLWPCNPNPISKKTKTKTPLHTKPSAEHKINKVDLSLHGLLNWQNA